MDGKVIGVVTSGPREEEGLAFCEPVDALLTAVSICQSQSRKQIDEQRTKHRARTVFKRINAAFELDRFAMKRFLIAFDRAEKAGTAASEAVEEVRESLSDSPFLRARQLFSDLEPDVAKVSSDSKLSNSIKERFVDFWTNYAELKSYVDNPRGNIHTFRDKSVELFDNHERQSKALRLLLGVPEQNK